MNTKRLKNQTLLRVGLVLLILIVLNFVSDPAVRSDRHDAEQTLHAFRGKQEPDEDAGRQGDRPSVLYGGSPLPLQQQPPDAARRIERVQGLRGWESRIRIHRPHVGERRNRTPSSRGSRRCRSRSINQDKFEVKRRTWGSSSCTRTRRKPCRWSRTPPRSNTTSAARSND